MKQIQPDGSVAFHDPLTCPCCQLAAERVREAEYRAAHERLGDALTAHEERKRLRALLTECADLIDSACPGNAQGGGEGTATCKCGNDLARWSVLRRLTEQRARWAREDAEEDR